MKNIKKCRDCKKDFKIYSTLDKFCRDCKIQNTKPMKQISDKKIKRLKDTWWESLLFKKVWNSRDHICFICKKHIIDPAPVCFAHILSKKDFPYLRNFENNIILVCNDISMSSCHTQLDKLIIWNKLEIEKKILKLQTNILE